MSDGSSFDSRWRQDKRCIILHRIETDSRTHPTYIQSLSGALCPKASDRGIKQTTDPIYCQRYAFTHRQNWILCYILCIQGDSEGKVYNLGGGSIGKFIWTCVWFWMVADTEVFEFPNLSPLNFCLWGWMKSEVYRGNVDTRDELLAWILDAPARVKKREDQLRRTTRDLRTRVTKCTEDDGGISENLLRTVKKLSYRCNKFVIFKH